MGFVTILGAAARGTTDLRRTPAVPARVRRPAKTGKGLAAVIVGGSTGAKTTRVPPAQQAATEGVPAADGSQALKEAVRGRLTTRRLRTPSLGRGKHHDGDRRYA